MAYFFTYEMKMMSWELGTNNNHFQQSLFITHIVFMVEYIYFFGLDNFTPSN